jgi:hypothetical protein
MPRPMRDAANTFGHSIRSPVLLVSQDNHWVDVQTSPLSGVASDQRYEREQRRDRAEGRRIDWAQPVEKAGEQVGESRL